MKFILTKKDIIALNQEFDQGTIINESSLDYVISYVRRTENWTKALAWLIRAILIDHVFEEANKRTSALLLKTYVEFEGYNIETADTIKIIKKIVTKNITSIKKIEDLIQNAIK